MNRRVVISGCSGGGKSTLLAALAARGWATVDEPGRRIIRDETARDGTALPWIDLTAFARRALAMTLADHGAAIADPVFFDRGWIDAASALDDLTGEVNLDRLGAAFRYHPIVFLAPPWPDIFATDAERRHGLEAATIEYERLSLVYPALGYELVILPRVSVTERVEFVLARLGL